MTTLQPRLVRADTLDLQPHNSPSAKDHTRSPTHASYNQALAGAHHREALRSAEQSAFNDQKLSPRVSVDDNHSSMVNQTHMYDSAEEEGEDVSRTAQQNGSYEHEEAEEEEDDLDDDLMDKISSSPSIEDGKYNPYPGPSGSGTLDCEATPASTPWPTRGSSFTSRPCCPSQEDNTLSPKETDNWPINHHSGEYQYKNDTLRDLHDDALRQRMCSESPTGNTAIMRRVGLNNSHSQDSLADITKYLLPVNDPLLDNAFDDYTNEGNDHQHPDHGDDEMNWIDEEIWYDDDDEFVGNNDDIEDFLFTSDTRFIDSGWGGECLRELEDIDFEFVYALHTFVATVEGQANATKGDTMVLLDDSNSYWWLVRVVKDGSIGYLPAEHIETPTERLARLNKHRNIDLAASMLGDNPEKSKNPLKKAMRRRNAKSVAFAAPTYHEPTHYLYSSDEEDEEGEEFDPATAQQNQETQQAANDISATDEAQDTLSNGVRPAVSDDGSVKEPGSPVKTDPIEPEAQAQQDESFQRSRNGVVRNTDSFFKDDTAETRKISLTPALLRSDKPSVNSAESERMSSETFDRLIGEDKGKEDKKRKEKKGVFGGLFKRKDKKGKTDTEEMQSPEEPLASPASKDSMDSPMNGPLSPGRKPSKLQKTPPIGPPSVSSPTEAKAPTKVVSAVAPIVSAPIASATMSNTASLSPAPLNVNTYPADASTITMVESQIIPQESNRAEQSGNKNSAASEKKSIFAPITTVLKSNHSEAEAEPPVKAVYAKRAKERFAIDASDSDEEAAPRMGAPGPMRDSISPIQDSQPVSYSRPDSAMQVSPIESPVHYLESTRQNSGRSDQYDDEDASTPIDMHGQSDTASTSKPSPSFAAHTPSTSRSTPTWSDASLRSYMENDQDIRDLLIIVHDKSNVTPVGPEHPLMGGLFSSERTRLNEMQNQLDSMLTTWMAKKNPALLASTK